MIKIENYDNNARSGLTYGGAAGSKLGILIEEEKWFLKYPKSTRSLEGVNLSYSTAPLSEYLGSHIYESVGIKVHETRLGVSDGKVVVACKDFLNSNEVLYDYNSIKNSYNSVIELEAEKLSSDFGKCSFEEIELMSKENIYFKIVPELYEHFWDMFIVDTLIDNHDRNNGNWGIILNKDTLETTIAPVYDNGAAFYNKNDDDKLKSILSDKTKFKQVAYDSAKTVFKLDDVSINPLKFIESLKNENCNRAILRIVPRINFEKIERIFDEIPFEAEKLKVLSKTQKAFYIEMMKYRYNNILLPTYQKLINR